MVFPEKHQSKYCIFQIDSPLTSSVTQASTCAYIQYLTDGARVPACRLMNETVVTGS